MPEREDSARAAKLRAFFARYVTERGGARSHPRIEQAFAAVPREPFAGPQPWMIAGSIPFFPAVAQYTPTPDDDPAFLYQDVLIALDEKRGINIGDPSLHAFCLAAVAIRTNETILHVGAGSGYYTAILAHLVGSEGRVYAFEIALDLAARARGNLSHLPWVEVYAQSGVSDNLPKVDVIYVSAGCTQPSLAWLQALNPGGRLLFPLQQERGFGGMLLVHRPVEDATIWPARFLTRAMFIPCEGLQDEKAGRRLADAFGGDATWLNVRSLRFDDCPNDTSWCAGDGWWLSTALAAPAA